MAYLTIDEKISRRLLRALRVRPFTRKEIYSDLFSEDHWETESISVVISDLYEKGEIKLIDFDYPDEVDLRHLVSRNWIAVLAKKSAELPA